MAMARAMVALGANGSRHQSQRNPRNRRRGFGHLDHRILKGWFVDVELDVDSLFESFTCCFTHCLLNCKCNLPSVLWVMSQEKKKTYSLRLVLRLGTMMSHQYLAPTQPRKRPKWRTLRRARLGQGFGPHKGLARGYST